MILSSSGSFQRCQLRGGWNLPGSAKNCECHESRKYDRSGWPPQVSTVHAIVASFWPLNMLLHMAVGKASILESMPACDHCWAMMLPARVMTGRLSPSVEIVMVNG